MVHEVAADQWTGAGNIDHASRRCHVEHLRVRDLPNRPGTDQFRFPTAPTTQSTTRGPSSAERRRAFSTELKIRLAPDALWTRSFEQSSGNRLRNRGVL